MRRFTILTFLLLVFIIHSGCAKYWYQEGVSFDECQMDRNECLEELGKRTDFTDASYEYKYLDECMKAKGYKKVFSKDLPLDIKRQAPENSLDYRERGIAGTLTEPQKSACDE